MDDDSLNEKNFHVYNLMTLIVCCYLCCCGIPVLPVYLILAPIIYYIRYQIRSFKRYWRLDLKHAEQDALSAINDVVNRPPCIKWTITCKRHKTPTCCSGPTYKKTVGHQWENNNLWIPLYPLGRPEMLTFVKPYVNLTVSVTHSYSDPFAPPEEQEIFAKHSECPGPIHLERQSEVIYNMFIGRDGHSVWWVPIIYWLSSLVLCSHRFYSKYIQNDEYKVEKVYTGYNPYLSSIESTTSFRPSSSQPPFKGSLQEVEVVGLQLNSTDFVLKKDSILVPEASNKTGRKQSPQAPSAAINMSADSVFYTSESADLRQNYFQLDRVRHF